METIHGTVVDVAGKGVLLVGPSGAGKSDLALRLMDRGAVLVADDQVVLEKRDKGVRASAPEILYGLMEVRGIGIVSLPAIKSANLELVVDLVASDDLERVPLPTEAQLAGEKIPKLKLHAFEVSAPHKIELALTYPEQIGLGVDDHKKD